MLFHEAGHFVIGWLHGVKGQVIFILRQPVGDDAAGASWDDKGLDDTQYIRRTVAGIHAQAIYAPGSFLSATSFKALDQGLVPAGREAALADLTGDAANDLSMARGDLAQLVNRLKTPYVGDLKKIAEAVKPHEAFVRAKLKEPAVEKCLRAIVAMLREQVNLANASGESVAMFGEAQCGEILPAELMRIEPYN